ncbi:NADP-dependent oxidoreductase [Rhizobium sp. L1K21]|uniref:NADP-dependent oxidoreductase n=1 Tax=Rhizobium sp. L1K21 TaxID=2954933 RepID=UPI002093C03F|nr:NADP-dependent oxidoreductase [Rhizobium sp. L1K21]MCO6187822.1 NADP-dependent oxidoreductase [Rhizobium sp. L1K21]
MASMKAVRIHHFGDEGALNYEDVSVPEPGRNQILVKVLAAGVNPVDWKMRKGGYPSVDEADLPITLGRDVCGRVAAVGSDVENCSEGERIIAFIGEGRGAYEEYALVEANEFAHMPRFATTNEAAALPLAGITAWQGLFDHGNLQAGQRVLIQGGSGGVGHIAIQLAKAKGAWVATTVSGSDIELAEMLGADQAINYHEESIEEALEPVDMVLDLIGGETQEQSFAVVKSGGILVSTVQEPSEALANLNGVRVAWFKAEPNGRQLADIVKLVEDEKVKIVLNRIFPLSEAAEAQRVLEHEHSRGKIVLELL